MNTPPPSYNATATPAGIKALSGDATIDALMYGPYFTNYWTGPVTYSFPTLASHYPTNYSWSPQTKGFKGLNEAQQAAVKFALDADEGVDAAMGFSVEAFTNLEIGFAGEGTGAATLRYATSYDANPTAYAYRPGTYMSAGDAWFGTQTGAANVSAPKAGNYGWQTFLHEIGHTLGLDHGHEADTFGNNPVIMPSHLDAMEYSLMTYRSYVGGPASGYTNESWGYAQTFMMFDIQTLQYLYGADFTSNAGDTVYSWRPDSGNTVIDGEVAIAPGANRIFATIWDGDGTDTYDLSAYATGVQVDLTPGGASKFSAAQTASLGRGHFASGNIYNALQYEGDARSLIENAIGGSGDDTLLGNEADNLLQGGAGNDILTGGEGDDTLEGGEGIDTLEGGAGDDLLRGTLGSSFDGGSGDDTIDYSSSTTGGFFSIIGGAAQRQAAPEGVSAFTSIENVIGSQGADVIQGTADDNMLEGAGGDDTISGGEGDDTLSGGAGDDLIEGGSGSGVISGGAGDDTIRAGSGDDTVSGGLGADVFTLDGLSGTLRITDFDAALDSFLADTWIGRKPYVTLVGDETVVTYGDQRIELAGVAIDEITLDHFHFAVGEVGQSLVGSVGVEIGLAGDYLDGIVLANPVTEVEAAPVAVRIDGMDGRSFGIRLQEPDDLDGLHLPELVSHLVIEAGDWKLADGTVVSAGTTEMDAASRSDFEGIGFAAGQFDGTPSIQTQVQTTNDADWVVTRRRDADADGVQIALQQAEGPGDGAHGTETVGWFAIEHGSGDWSGVSYEAGAVDGVTDASARADFDAGFAAAPGVLGSMGTFAGSNTAIARVSGADGSGFGVRSQEETNGDDETKHWGERIDYFAFEGAGTLTAQIAQTTVAEYGSSVVSDGWVEITLEESFFNPVVLASVSTGSDPLPGSVRLDAVTGGGFRMRLQGAEGEAPPQDVSWMVVEAGSWTLGDGRVLQAGHLEADTLGEAGLQDVALDAVLGGASASVLAQVQTSADAAHAQTVTRRGEDGGVQITMIDDAGSEGARTPETVGFVAVSGGIGLAGDDALDAGRGAEGDLPSGAATVLTQAIDTPISFETVGASAGASEIQFDYLALTGDGVLEGSVMETATFAEVGTVIVGSDLVEVDLTHVFVDPVVLVMSAGNAADPVAPRLVEVGPNGFSIELQEPNYADGSRAPQELTYVVIESGTWMLADGTLVSAGSVETDKLSSDGFETVSFDRSFDDTPSIFSQVQSKNGQDWVVTRQKDAGADGFQLTMQEEETGNRGSHVTETIGWLAVERGAGDWDGHAFEAGTTGDIVDDEAQDFVFNTDFTDTPTFLASLASFDGRDTSYAAHAGLTAEGVTLNVAEEQSRDSEIAHTTESIDYLALEATGLLSGYDLG